MGLPRATKVGGGGGCSWGWLQNPQGCKAGDLRLGGADPPQLNIAGLGAANFLQPIASRRKAQPGNLGPPRAAPQVTLAEPKLEPKMGKGWRRAVERLKQKTGQDRGFVPTSGARWVCG